MVGVMVDMVVGDKVDMKMQIAVVMIVRLS
jgi:hypothetical protein